MVAPEHALAAAAAQCCGLPPQSAFLTTPGKELTPQTLLERHSAWVLSPQDDSTSIKILCHSKTPWPNTYPSHTRPISFLFHHQFCTREQRRVQVWVSSSSPESTDSFFNKKGHMQCTRWLWFSHKLSILRKPWHIMTKMAKSWILCNKSVSFVLQ